MRAPQPAYVYSVPVPFGGSYAAVCSVHGEFMRGGGPRWAEGQQCPACVMQQELMPNGPDYSFDPGPLETVTNIIKAGVSIFLGLVVIVALYVLGVL